MVVLCDAAEIYLTGRCFAWHKCSQWVCMWLCTHNVVVSLVNHVLSPSTLFVLFNGDTFRLGTLAMLLRGASIFFFFWSLLKVVSSLFCRFSSNFSLGQKKRSDHMIALMMLNSTKNQTIWYGAKMASTTLRIKLVPAYIVSSTSMSTYIMCKASMSNFTFLRMTRIKQKWMAIWKHNF